MQEFPSLKFVTKPEGFRPQEVYAAVNVLFVPHNGEWKLLLTRRSPKLKSHSGQVSFAGGKADPSDTDVVATAWRESEEELGLPCSQYEFCGFLKEMTSIHNVPVYPIVSRVTSFDDSQLNLNTDEVAEIYLVPAKDVAESLCQTFSFTVFGKRRYSKHFNTSAVSVWGLTAEILFQAALKVP